MEKNSKSILLIIGDGELKEEINTKIKDLNLKGKVYMMGSREDVDNILQAVDVFLFPSFWEGLPVAVVEAEASGLPCILSESVTEEVKLLPNLKYLPINQGEGVWVNYILNMKKID
ncbi:glycosyltransferase [Anaerococcus obesiensis]|uniref:Glycosyltransferase n=1 Tax=Anaerococcus obesiensis TaxID=1287640 RepID=A0A7T7UUG7_9FIRM|nr:glycosyltransferase [Anaerococcus obesiensis]QQN56446.1 glycosyltransferase [Anaerococcus obesiensis]